VSSYDLNVTEWRVQLEASLPTFVTEPPAAARHVSLVVDDPGDTVELAERIAWLIDRLAAMGWINTDTRSVIGRSYVRVHFDRDPRRLAGRD
jgi:hypothetical protein